MSKSISKIFTNDDKNTTFHDIKGKRRNFSNTTLASTKNSMDES
jgi:hypothetical protein